MREFLGAARAALLLAVWVGTAALSAAQDPPLAITLEQASARAGGDFGPAYDGRQVQIRGQITQKPVYVVGSEFVSIVDASGFGLILRGRAEDFSNLVPGDWVEVLGTIQRRGGMPMLTPDSIEFTRHTDPPQPVKLPLGQLAGMRYLGLSVETKGTVAGIGANGGGKLVMLRDGRSTVNVFLPNPADGAGSDLSFIHTGDRVRVRGLATQYDQEPPYNGNFEVLVGSVSGIEVVEPGPVAPPWMVVVIGVMVMLAGTAWWIRVRRVHEQRAVTRAFHTLSEQIIAANSPAGIAEHLSNVIPQVIRASAAELYLFNRNSKSLERVPTEANPEPMVAPVEFPPDGMANAAVVCFRNRTALSVPDVRRNPLIKAASLSDLPRSAFFLPLMAGPEPLGVLEIDNDRRVGYFSPEDQAAAQHLANQVAASLRLQAQQVMREQLFRTEKQAATGQLISGVAGELKAPLERIAQLGQILSSESPADPLLRELGSESRRAEGIVSRLMSFSGREDAGTQAGPQTSSSTADVHGVLRGLVQFRDPEWREFGIRVNARIPSETAVAPASRGHIEQVFLNLLVHAQQRTLEGSAKNITLQSSILAGKLQVEISYSAPRAASGDLDGVLQPPQAQALGLGVCHAIVASLGGEIRFRSQPMNERFEVELPLAGAHTGRPAAPSRAREASAAKSRPLTVMLVDSDPSAQKQLVALLGGRGHRVVPALATEVADIAHRLKFDAIFWAVRTGAGRWSDYHERLRNSIVSFVLLSEGYDGNLARSLEANGGFLLATPVGEAELDRVLAEIALRTQESAAR